MAMSSSAATGSSAKHPPARNSPRRRARALPAFEPVEVRRLLSTVIVNKLGDETAANPTRSLREAIQMAATGDTIAFKAGLAGQITLGGTELLVGKHLTVTGPGAS